MTPSVRHILDQENPSLIRHKPFKTRLFRSFSPKAFTDSPGSDNSGRVPISGLLLSTASTYKRKVGRIPRASWRRPGLKKRGNDGSLLDHPGWHRGSAPGSGVPHQSKRPESRRRLRAPRPTHFRHAPASRMGGMRGGRLYCPGVTPRGRHRSLRSSHRGELLRAGRRRNPSLRAQLRLHCSLLAVQARHLHPANHALG